jgi:sugar lactone lactonase YvrE
MFFAPAGLVLNSQGDIIYVADSLNNRIRSVKLDTMAVSTLAGNGKPGFFDNVGRLAVLNNPQGITFDPTNTYLYFSDTGNHVIRRIWIATAQLITLAGSSTGLSGYSDGVGTSTLFNTPVGLIVDPLGLSIYVADQANNCIRSITILSLAVTTLVGNGTATFNDAIGTSAAMKRPSGLAMDSGALNLYFTDTGNHRIRQVNLLTRVTTTLAGSGVAKWADGVGTSASFNSPVGIALSPNDAFLFIADASNNRLRRISLATLAVTTISGSFTGSSGLGDGWGTSAVFNLPNGIAFDASSGALSTLYVADMQNNVVRKVQLTPAWCDPGFYCPLRSSMPNGTGSCAAGTYCNGVSTTPLICPAGLWCGAQTSSASGSGLCQTGYFCPAGSPNSTMFRCPLGTFCPPGSSAAFPCAAGSFCASSASQVACTAGSYCPASSTIMDACTPGSMCPTPTVQTVCAAGTYCPARSTSALPCPAGAYCPAGTSSANANICPFGTFCAPGSTAPSFCPIGSYCLNTTTQLICASGSFCPAYSTAPSACQAGSYCSSPLQQVTCSAGYYCPVSSTSQIICPVGRYCPAGSSSPSLVCPTGVFCPTGMTGIGGAGLCSPGSYCIAGSSSSTQAQCGGGFFCPAGSTAATGSGMCSQGYYCPVGSMNETGAGPCTAGYTCPIGSMYPTGRNMLRRDVCPAGYFCPAGSWVSVACRPGLFSPTTGAASCSFCPSGMFSNTTASTSCQPCPDKMFCLLGNPVPIPASYQQNTSQTVFNPFPLESIEANNQLTTITMSIASVMGAVFFCFVLFSVSAKRLLPRRVLQSFKSLDMLFGAAHVIEDGDYYRVYTTWLGGIFTLLTVCLILLVGALLTLQNTTVPTQTTDLSTAPPASDPLGYFAIEVGVFGSDLSTACANMSISQGAPGDWIGTVVRAKPVYTAKFNSCVVRWTCAKCSIGSRTLNPTFTLTSILPSWASFYNITLWTPALGGVGLLPFSVNQIFSPTATISDLSGFRSSATANDPAVKPSMVLQLTSFTVKTGSETNPTVRTTFQPSITSATSQPVNGPDIMDPSVSSTDLLKFSATAGFQLSLLLQRNTLNIVVYVYFCVLWCVIFALIHISVFFISATLFSRTFSTSLC